MRISTMTRSHGGAGFDAPRACRLVPTDDTVAASLAIGRAVAMPDRHAYGAFDQGHHGDAFTGFNSSYFSTPWQFLRDSARRSAWRLGNDEKHLS